MLQLIQNTCPQIGASAPFLRHASFEPACGEVTHVAACVPTRERFYDRYPLGTIAHSSSIRVVTELCKEGRSTPPTYTSILNRYRTQPRIVPPHVAEGLNTGTGDGLSAQPIIEYLWVSPS